MRLRALVTSPVAVLVLGSLTIAWAGIFVSLADVSVATSATFRCAYALPPLLVMSALAGRLLGQRTGGERRRLDAASRRTSVIAGAGLAGRLLFWHAAIASLGAGLAAVLVDLQVVFVPLIAALVLGYRVRRLHLVVLPFVVLGCVLVAGVLGGAADGSRPLLGVLLGVTGAVMYAIYQLGLGATVRATGSPLLALTAASAVSAGITGGWGLVTGTLSAPSWPAHGWLLLLALGVQVAGWSLIARAMHKLRAPTVSVVLVLHPVATLLLGVVLLGEHPAPLQWVGVVVILIGVVTVAATDPGPEPTIGEDGPLLAEAGELEPAAAT